MSLKIVVLISGYGSNLQAIIDACKQGLDVEIRAVISSCNDAYGLQRASKAQIPAVVVERKNFLSRQAFNQALLQQIEQFQPDIIVLAGFMIILEGEILHRYSGKILNIHPALLPKYPGLHTHKQVLQHKDLEHGVSIHFVDESLDGGPIICQAKCDVLPEDTVDSLQKKVQILEHQIYPLALDWLATKRLSLAEGKVKFDGETLPKSGKLLNL